MTEPMDTERANEWQPAGSGRRALRGGLTGAGALIVYIAVSFLITPYVLGRIGATGYGLFILVSSLFAYGAILDLGIGGALVKLVAEYRARDEPENEAVLIATAVRMYTALALIGLALTFAVAAVVPTIFSIPPEDQNTALLITILIGTNLAIAIFSTPAASIMAGLQRYDVQNLIRATGTIGNALATVAVLALGGGLVGMVAVNIPFTIAMRFASAWYIRRTAPELALRWQGGSRWMLRRILPLSAAIFVTQLSGPLTKKTDEIVIGAFLVVSSITPFALAGKLSEVPFQMTSQFSKVLVPIAAQLDATAGRLPLRDLYLTSTRAALAIFLPMALVLLLYADLILTMWVGPAYGDAAPIVVILVVANLALIVGHPAGAVLQGMGRFHIVAASGLILSVVNLALSLLLVRPLGIAGVAVGTLIPNVIGAIVIVLPYTMRVLDVSVRSIVGRVWIPVLLPAVVSGVVLLQLRTMFDLTSLGALVIASCIGGLVYFALYFVLPFTRPERTVALDMVRRLLRGARRLFPDGNSRSSS